MIEYFKTINPEFNRYFSILEPEFPEWLEEYINTPELLHQQYISMTCGTIYSKLFNSNYFYSSLDHSIGVALIVWHFTHDKKQTLSGLFHDIATPAFKHSIDFMNGDYMNQESTEDLTTEIIKNSKEIMLLLKRDGIDISEVDNYHLYPIADNDTPKLSADRLEYSLSNALFTYKSLDFDEISKMYNDISIQYNENNEIELGFNTRELAKLFVKTTSALSIIYREDRTRYSMQLIADILKRLSEDGLLTRKDLYVLKEEEIFNIIMGSKYADICKKWLNAEKVKVSDKKPEGVYSVHVGSKVRYIDPLCKGERISKCYEEAKKMIENNLAYKMANYVYLDFDF